MDARRKTYRILALAIVFFLAGLWFLWKDWSLNRPKENRDSFQLAAPPLPSTSHTSPFANFPAPGAFRTFSHVARDVSSSTIIVDAQCADVYLTLLIFPADIDYRDDPSRAVMNRAFSCAPGEPFHYLITKEDMKALQTGDFYLIVADQGSRGTWYNPR